MGGAATQRTREMSMAEAVAVPVLYLAFGKRR